MMCPTHAREMKPPTTKCFLRILLMLSLSTGPVGCFIVSGGGGRSRSTAQRLRPNRGVDRPLQSDYAGTNAAAPMAVHPASRSAGVVDLGGQRSVSTWRRAGSGVDRACWRKKGVRLFAAEGEGEEDDDEAVAAAALREGVDDRQRSEKELEVEKNYTPEEREFVEFFFAEHEAAEEPERDEDELAVYDHGYKMYAGEGGAIESEWDAAVGKGDIWDLSPYEDFDPKVPPVHYKYSNEDLQASLTSEVNPFPLHSEWVDRDIKVANIDEDKKAAIQPMMSVIEQVCQLIDTTDDVFSFKGPRPPRRGFGGGARGGGGGSSLSLQPDQR
ncbi:expressed unknown protein [Ectocarpus siliculosus]|uniref:Uncharacterized protein n=1 Tax=Ectocarpus siliculosus TaxID=2880 RepID=D7FHK5_ECTSI|nr:expressed unknown protein [Ectocarpus siliculosus]|eukprot:CBJ28562.1 expressed unknown protein [Ectocarpus siliculosus]